MGGFQLPNPFSIAPQQVQPTQGHIIPPNEEALQGHIAQQQMTQQGIQQLMTGLVNVTQGEQQHYRQKYDDAVAQIGNGTLPNPDYKQIAEWGRKGGIPMKSTMTQAELQAHQLTKQQTTQQQIQDAQNQQYQSLAQSGAPGAQQVADAFRAMGPLLPTPPQQAPPPAPQLSAWQRMRQAMPQGQQYSDQSPMVQYLQSLNQAGQSQGGAPGNLARSQEMPVLAANVQKAMANLQITNAQGVAPLMKQAFDSASSGDQGALQMLDRLGVMKGVPIDEVGALMKYEHPEYSPAEANARGAQLLLWQQGGGPTIQAKMADFTKELLPRFGGDLAASSQYVNGLFSGTPTGLKPGMTPQEFQQYTEGTKKIIDRYPTAPAGLAHAYGMAMMNGQDELGKNMLDFLQSHYKGAQDIASSQFQTSISKDYAQIASVHDIGQQDADSQKMRVYTEALDQMSGPTKHIIENPGSYQPEQVQGAYRDWMNKTNGLASKTLKINGVDQPLGPLNDLLIHYNLFPGMQGTMKGSPVMNPPQVPAGVMQQMMGTPPTNAPQGQHPPNVMPTSAMPGAPQPPNMIPGMSQLLMYGQRNQ